MNKLLESNCAVYISVTWEEYLALTPEEKEWEKGKINYIIRENEDS